MKDIMESLNKLGTEIATAKTSVSQLEGRKTEIVKRMTEEFKVSTVDDAEVLLDQRTTELETLEGEIKAEFTDLKTKFSW